jgi:hypothetical protein
MPGQRHAAMDTGTELFIAELLGFLEESWKARAGVEDAAPSVTRSWLVPEDARVGTGPRLRFASPRRVHAWTGARRLRRA